MVIKMLDIQNLKTEPIASFRDICRTCGLEGNILVLGPVFEDSTGLLPKGFKTQYEDMYLCVGSECECSNTYEGKEIPVLINLGDKHDKK